MIVTDQAGKQRRSVTDGLGALIEVDEPSAPSVGLTNSNGYVQVNGTELWGGGAAATATVGFSGYENSGPGNPTCKLVRLRRELHRVGERADDLRSGLTPWSR